MQVMRKAPELTDVDVPSQCCVMRSPYLYSSWHISGIFIRNEYVQALKDIIAFCKGEQFAPNIDNAESSVALTPFPTIIANPFAGTEFPTEPLRSGVIVTGSPGIGEYDRLGCVGYLTRPIQANLCYWTSSYTCAILPGVKLYLFETSGMQTSSTPLASSECRIMKSLNPNHCHPFGCSSTQTAR
jgi:hypothetical protein